MPWDGGPFGGFSKVRPWLRMAPDVATRNVATQAQDPSSVLATYRRLIWLRRQHPALQVGTYRRLPTAAPDLFVYERAAEAETVLVAANFGRTARHLRLQTGRRWTVIHDTHGQAVDRFAGGDELELRPLEAIVLRAS
jgi:alpha-glucosidase